MTRYDAAYLALAPLALPWLAYRRWACGKYRESLPGMFGRWWQTPPGSQWAQGCLWIHAVSVGECVAARALGPKLRQRLPNWPCLVTTVTETGQAFASKLRTEFADETAYFPADFSWVVAKFLDTYRPSLLVIMETELWPNTLQAAKRRGATIVLANGRLSDQSFLAYRRFRGFFRGPLSCIDAFCMQSEQDAERIAAIGAPRDRIYVTGNCKFDVSYPKPTAERLAELRRLLRLPADAPVVVVGSTHAGEEEIIMRAWSGVRERVPACRLLLVPRHPERFDAVWQLVSASGYAAYRLSAGSGAQTPEVILVDRMGMLSELYALATVAVVAGSFVPGIGGHNILEAAVHGIPVIYGPHMEKQPELVRILSPERGGVVAAGENLGATLLRFLEDRDLRAKHGELARRAAQSQQGAAAKTAEIVAEVYHRSECSRLE